MQLYKVTIVEESVYLTYMTMVVFQVCVIAFCLVGLALARENKGTIDAPPAFTFPYHFLETCLTKYGRVSELLSQLQVSDVATLVREYSDAMGTFCHTPYPNNQSIYYTCTRGTSTKDQLSVRLCAPNTGDACPVRVIDEGESVTRSSCDSSTCDAKCWRTLNAVKNYVGCCANNMYQDSWASPYFIPTNDNSSCGIDVRARCLNIVPGDLALNLDNKAKLAKMAKWRYAIYRRLIYTLIPFFPLGYFILDFPSDSFVLPFLL